MNKSISFDRAADFYDHTRDLPQAIAAQGIPAILEAAGPGARILDVGTGTGRISVPLLKLGADLLGCDLSSRMMSQLRQKIPDARLVQADASQLPFPANHFDALLTVHVMHLIGPWRQALREYRRVLKPDGVYINARTESGEDQTPAGALSEFWQSRVAAHGANPGRPGIRDKKELHEELLGMGAQIREIPVTDFSRTYSLRARMERLANRIDSQTWNIPEDVLSASLHELDEWVTRTFDDLDKVFEEKGLFVLDITRFN